MSGNYVIKVRIINKTMEADGNIDCIRDLTLPIERCDLDDVIDFCEDCDIRIELKDSGPFDLRLDIDDIEELNDACDTIYDTAFESCDADVVAIIVDCKTKYISEVADYLDQHDYIVYNATNDYDFGVEAAEINGLFSNRIFHEDHTYERYFDYEAYGRDIISDCDVYFTDTGNYIQLME